MEGHIVMQLAVTTGADRLDVKDLWLYGNIKFKLYLITQGEGYRDRGRDYGGEKCGRIRPGRKGTEMPQYSTLLQ